jgi:hypothetical protein
MASQSGSLFFFIPFMLHFIMNINEILREKSKKLREGISVMGMTHYAYWISWMITTIVITSILVFFHIINFYVFNIKVMTNVPIVILFFFFLSSDLSI